MYVCYNKHNSNERNLSYGVPQGSVLGQLLFILYINDLPSCLSNSKCILFADDTTIYCHSHSTNDLFNKIQKYLDIVDDWFKANKLSLNVNKTKFMIFPNTTNVTSNMQIKVGDNQIEQVANFKLIGIILDQNLNC